jgi:hypothetical protein
MLGLAWTEILPFVLPQVARMTSTPPHPATGQDKNLMKFLLQLALSCHPPELHLPSADIYKFEPPRLASCSSIHIHIYTYMCVYMYITHICGIGV